MGERKSAAIIIAMFAAILVMLAGKSCSENMKRERQKNNAPVNTLASRPSQENYAETTRSNAVVTVLATEPGQSQIEYITDILGRVVGTVEHSTEATETTTVPQVEYVTDILGRVVKVIEPTTEAVETTTESDVMKNPLAEYWEQHSTAPATRDQDIEEQHYKAPSTLQITIG